MTIYGTTVDDVRGLLPHRLISAASRPTEAQVTQIIDAAEGWVANRLGDLATLPVDELARVNVAARGVASFYAASLTEAAGAPERAGMANAGYGGWLWDRFKEGLDELLESLNKPTGDVPGGHEAPIGDLPAIVAPPPLFIRDSGF